LDSQFTKPKGAQAPSFNLKGELKMTTETTTITAIIANNAFLLRLVDGAYMSLEQIQQHFPDAKHHLPFFKEHGDACVQYVIRGKDTMKYDFTNHQQFQL
tara:strand:+ start:242 stop:541 length:300 start_codon:yes stop_codon:yes gene_type:complete